MRQERAKFRFGVQFDGKVYEDEDFRIIGVPDLSPASVWGIYIKKTEDFVVRELFYDDDDKRYESFYESDEQFQQRSHL